MADSADLNYTTFCAHCETCLPPRTFRYHREKFYDEVNNVWEKNNDGLSSDEDVGRMETDLDFDNPYDSDEHQFDSAMNDSTVNGDEDHEGLLYHEVWDNTQRAEIDEDFVENHETPPSVDVQAESTSRTNRTLHTAFTRCLIILLAYFWTCFCISDNGMEFLLAGLKHLFESFSLSSNLFAGLAVAFPGTLYCLKKQLGLAKDKFKKYVVCPKCHSLYTFDQCYDTIGSCNKSKKCSFVKFANHRQRWRRRPCGETLLKEVTLKDNSKRLYPHKVYCYQNIIDSLRRLVKRQNFANRCELWRSREVRSVGQLMGDVFDWRVWRDFQTYEGVPYLAAPRNYGLMLNVDWMQPFDHTIYSVGVLYLVLMNLPRNERFKRENVILVGIIPGPSEPPLNINTYLSPLVDELLVLWNDGVMMRHACSFLPERFKAALLCVASDIPASRKVCGFTGHHSRMGCNKCTKAFEVGNCRGRNGEEHRRQIDEILAQTTQEARSATESLYGARYSELLRLPYFDCVRFTVVDPMHNLFLGTAKRLVEVWLQMLTLSANDLQQVQEKVDSCHVPSELGRIPSKIAKMFAGFTAEQWKNWVTVFSLFALFQHLPERDYRCWAHFVNACNLLCTTLIKIPDVGIAHDQLIQFCKEFENIYGKDRVTPNMHLHMHLADCVLDYGPVYSFWLFSFERYNGILGKYHTNNKSVELQMMRKFTRDQDLDDLEFPREYSDQLQPLISKVRGSTKTQAPSIDCKKILSLLKLSEGNIDIANELWYSVDCFSFGPPHVIGCLDDDDLRYLTEVYRLFFPDALDITIPRLYDQYASLECAGERFGSRFSRLNRCSFVLAKWAGPFDGEVDMQSTDIRPGVIMHFVKHSVSVDGKRYAFSFARVDWYHRHPDRFLCGPEEPFPEVWCANQFDTFGAASFMPVQRILGKFVPGYDRVNDENVMFVMPLAEKFKM